MKILKLFFLLLFTCNMVWGQKYTSKFLINKDIITYIDNTENCHFAVSFVGDTIIPSEDFKNIFIIDSMMVQIRKYAIPENMSDFRWDPKKEKNLFVKFRDYEFDYMEKEVYQEKLKCQNINFTNKYTKNFLIWYFKVPDKFKEKNQVDQLDSESGKNLVVDYQLFLMFTTNGYITMINMPVFNNEDLSKKIEMIKSEIANSVRIYTGDIDFETLSNQIRFHQEQSPFIINDTINGIELCVPYWLNIENNDKFAMFGAFPDIYNISNAFLFTYFEKSDFNSFNDFKDRLLLGENVRKYEKLISTNKKIERYKVIYHSADTDFICQYVFIDIGELYALVNFTATGNTYEKNVERFNEFLKSIKLVK